MRFLHFYRIVLVMASAFLLYSCSKSGADCFNTSGEITKQTRQISEFDSVNIGDYVNVIVQHNDAPSVTVEAGSNVVAGISTEVRGHCLYIRNNNICNWVRDYDKPINVYIRSDSLNYVLYNSSGNLTSSDSVFATQFTLDIWGGCGSIDLTLSAHQTICLYHMGSVDVSLRGKADFNSVYAGDYGPVHAENLISKYTDVVNAGSNNCWVVASESLNATINSIGDIYYRGSPEEFITHQNGSGKILPF